MISTQPSQELFFVQKIKTYLEGITEQSLSQLGKKLFPIMSQSNIWASLFNCIHTFYSIRINKHQKFEDGTNMILKYAQDMKDQQVLPKITSLLNDNEFTQRLEDLVRKQLEDRKITNIPNGINPSIRSNPNSQLQNGQRQNIVNNNSIHINGSNIAKKNQQAQKNNMNNIVDISDDSPSEKQSVQTNSTPNKIQITNQNNGSNLDTHNQGLNGTNNILASDPYEVSNLSLKQVCLCGKSCQLMQPKKDFVFKCCHCHLNYHIECMQRGKANINQTDPIKKLVSCAYCHLKQLGPLKQVMKTLFVGVLKQGRKRHEIIFNLDMMDLKTKKWRVQVRCFRLKDKIQTFTLFPDSASFSINNRFEKQFLPLPKQSSLKYRKDEPFLLTQHLINHENKLTIIERIPKKQSRDDRIEPENHLLGIYLVEDKPVATLVREVRSENAFTFYQSKAMLDRCLRIGDAEDITCEVLKIPIICSLTIERIKTPVRGIFCSHFQCFDLNNFLILTSTSANPRWLCPLCKQPAYSFKYDVIIGSIIDQFGKHQPTQIMFTKDGEFKVYSNEDVCPGLYTNINDLPIDSKYKRQLQNGVSEEEVTRQAEMITDVEEHKIESETQLKNGNTSINTYKNIQSNGAVQETTTTTSVLNQSSVGLSHNTQLGNNTNISNNCQKRSSVTGLQHQSQQKQFQIPQNASIISLDDD